MKIPPDSRRQCSGRTKEDRELWFFAEARRRPGIKKLGSGKV